MIDDAPQDIVFKSRCRILFERMYGCGVEEIPYTSYYSHDFVVHAKDHDRFVKCICAEGPIDRDTVQKIFNIQPAPNADSILITYGTFTDDAKMMCRDLDHKVTMIDGTACSRLFSYYSVGYETDLNLQSMSYTKYNAQMSGKTVREPTLGIRLLAVLLSLGVPGAGCIVLCAYTNDKRYVSLGIALFGISVIMAILTMINNAFFMMQLAAYILSIVLSFVTLDVIINDDAATERRELQTRPKDDPDEEYFNEGFKKRYFQSYFAMILGLFIPGAGAMMLFYISRDKKHIIWGNILFWTSFAMVCLINTVGSQYILPVIILIQILSVVYTIRNIDEDVRHSMRPLWRMLFILVTLYVGGHLIRGFLRDPDFITRLFQTVLDVFACTL